MANGIKAVTSSPVTPSPALRKSSSNSQNVKNQKTLLGFFGKGATPSSSTSSTPTQNLPTVRRRSSQLQAKDRAKTQSYNVTPAPSSDAVGEDDSRSDRPGAKESARSQKGLPSPMSSANGEPIGQTVTQAEELTAFGTPSRRAKKKALNYAESDSEGTHSIDDDLFKPAPSKTRSARPGKRRRLSESGDEDVYKDDENANVDVDDDDVANFIVADDSDDEVRRPVKRKRASHPSSKGPASHQRACQDDEGSGLELPEASSTAQQWTFDPNAVLALRPRSSNARVKPAGGQEKKYKDKVHTKEPEDRYPWLADIRDIDKHPPSHPDYDPRTIYIPPLAWAGFSPFEKQYWEIKQKFWDTIVFFKKGKFYELYENDATIGHQLFDLRLTDRVNMRMVGVPESSLELWANQFVAKGFKIARVDQSESALSKEMRERDEQASGNKKTGKEKIIKRELACVLTAGTLVDGSMLQDDMATFCVAIKESLIEDEPAFGISFVDTATGQFHMAEFVDDASLTKFETFVAQTRPQELLLEKGNVSVKALRVLKNNTGPTTIWNYMKPGKEFWEPHITVKELEASEFFPDAWPAVLQEAKEKELLMSAFGALTQYLRTLKIERDLITIGNFSWYDPIRKASSLVLDGQTLINLEVFANSFDGGSEGTLFQLLNRCVTPFGKRLLKAWVCHPLMDTKKINARLDAVDSLNADTGVRDRFTSQMSKMPDLERLISRVHSGHCKAQDFVRVLDGFEQTDYTISLLRSNNGESAEGEGVIGQLIAAMPDLSSRLEYWKSAFDRGKARKDGILVPERGIEEDFDRSHDGIEAIQAELNGLLKKWRKELGSSTVCFRDSGKEIFQLEVPAKVGKVPKNWDQMSATKQVKRYYFPELRALVRRLQEAQETHAQAVKEVAGRFYARFDEDYEIWLAAVKIIAQLDCLVSLAKASASLGQPSCRPEFVDSDEEPESVLELMDLRHPCLLSGVTDFIPNDIMLGGSQQGDSIQHDSETKTKPRMTLLTGANAAGKSTVLRMTCVAVIMAQIGCHLPCGSARLTACDRIMSRLGAQDHIFAAQSTFLVELAETQKILREASPRSLVILDELGRGTSSQDGVAVAQAVLHHLATHVGCLGFFATHYHGLAAEFAAHPSIRAQRMQILVDDAERRVTFLYKLEPGVAEGSFGMHCASMCGVGPAVVQRAEVAARDWEYTGRRANQVAAPDSSELPLGLLSDVAWLLRLGEKEEEEGKGGGGGGGNDNAAPVDAAMAMLLKCIQGL